MAPVLRAVKTLNSCLVVALVFATSYPILSRPIDILHIITGMLSDVSG